jgi:trimethylamine--corrinoid protein Co-methyltransferase
MSGFLRQFKPIDVMTDAQEEAIHQAALEILEAGGAHVRHQRGLELLAENGCRVDFESYTARIPTSVADHCLVMIASSYPITGRDPAASVRLGGNRYHFMQGMGMRYVDPDTWELRPGTLAEVDEVYLVADALPNIHVIDSTQSITDIVGVPPIMQHLECVASAYRMSGKPQHIGYLKHFDQFAVKMAQGLGVTPDVDIDIAPPIAFTEDAVEAMFRYAPLGWGLEACPGGYAGATAPATQAGLVVQWWAATIAFVVLAKLIDANAAISLEVAGGVVHPKWANPVNASPESWFAEAMSNQLCRRYSLPIAAAQGFCGESKMFDYQAAWEKSLGVLSSVLSGSHMNVFQGSHATELGYSAVLAVMDDDIAGAIGRYLQGAVVDDETMAVGLQLQMGSAPTSFLNTPHTRQYWMKDRFMPALADTGPYEEWVNAGKPDVVSKGRSKVEEIVASHKPMPLAAEQQQAIEDVLHEAREYCRERDLITEEEWGPYTAALQRAGRWQKAPRPA